MKPWSSEHQRAIEALIEYYEDETRRDLLECPLCATTPLSNFNTNDCTKCVWTKHHSREYNFSYGCVSWYWEFYMTHPGAPPSIVMARNSKHSDFVKERLQMLKAAKKFYDES